MVEKINEILEENSEQKEDILTDEVYHIFDKVFKKILTLSSRAVINLINGLFGMDFPLDSSITYNWTEFVDDNLKRILADTIITIDGKYSYHLEAQMEKDNCIVFRVFEYGLGHANRNRMEKDGKYVLRFPRSMVIYLYYEGNVPDEYSLILEFGEGREVYEYKVPVLKLPEISAKELCERKMVILIPFHVLKLRYALKKGGFDSVEELQRHILDDIIGHINENVQAGNITVEDALKLKRNLHKLCDYLSKHHKELEGIPDMTDESFMTDIDIMCKIHEQCVEKLEARVAEHEEKIAKQDAEIIEKDEQLAKKDEEIQTLKKQLEELKK